MREPQLTPDRRMNRQEAVQFLHDRHPGTIDAPDGDDVDFERLHLEFFWFQSRVCEHLDRRGVNALRRCFATMNRVLEVGDRDVLDAVYGHFVQPHLVFHEDLEWAKQHMPPLLAELCGKAREWIDAAYAPNPPSGPQDSRC